MERDIDIPLERHAEYEALVALLVDAADPTDSEAPRLARFIAARSMEPGHLWRSMGLESRDELKRLMATHFRPLYDANDRDMRWKKFFYKRLCGWPGFHG